MKTRVLFLLFGALLLVPGFAQVSPVIEWERNYGGSEWEHAKAIVQTSDGGFIVAGFTRSIDGDVTLNHGFADIWIVKLGNTGTIQWQSSIGGSEDDYANSIAQTSDGGFVVAGYSESADGDVTNNHGTRDFWIVKLDTIGAIQWQISLGGSDHDDANSIAQTSDGGYIVAGSTQSANGDVTNSLGGIDYWIVKLDSTGTILWQRTFGGSSGEVALSIIQTLDEGYIVAGYSHSMDGDLTNNHGNGDAWIVKLDDTGTIQWQNSYGGSFADRAQSITQTSDGGFVFAGFSGSIDGDVTVNQGAGDYWIVKLNSAGTIEWERSYGGSTGEIVRSLAQTSEGGYIVAGYSSSTDGDVTNNHGGLDYWVLKMDDMGSIEWQNSYGGSADEFVESIIQTNDGGYIIAGSSRSIDGDVTNNYGVQDLWIVKLSGEFPTEILTVPATESFSVSPNPAKGSLLVTTTHPQRGTTLTLSDALGREVLVERMNSTTHTLVVGELPRGVYVVTLRSGTSKETQRVVLE